MTSKRSTIRAVSAITAAALCLALAACGSHTSSHAAPRTTSVAIRNYAYNPPTITVAQGATVTFVNRDQTAHTATATGSAFDTGTLKPGQRSSVHLDKAGTYTYYCQFHAFMRGTIVVR